MHWKLRICLWPYVPDTTSGRSQTTAMIYHILLAVLYIHFFGLSLDFNLKHEEGGGGKCEDAGKTQNTKPST